MRGSAKARPVWHVAQQRRSAKDPNDLNTIRSELKRDPNSVQCRKSDAQNLWITKTNGGLSAPKQILSGADDGVWGMAWTPENRIAYVPSASGDRDIWIMDADGTNLKQLTVDAGTNAHPSVSPDNRYIVFVSNRAGQLNIWRMDADGSNFKQLTNGSMEYAPYCSPDNRWVVYHARTTGKFATLWKVPIDGGDPVELTDKPATFPVVSPDGKMIACNYGVDQGDLNRWRIAIIPFAGGQPLKTLDVPTYPMRQIQWSPDGRALTYLDVREGVSNIWSSPLDGSPPHQLTDFKADQIQFAGHRMANTCSSGGTCDQRCCLISDSDDLSI